MNRIQQIMGENLWDLGLGNGFLGHKKHKSFFKS